MFQAILKQELNCEKISGVLEKTLRSKRLPLCCSCQHVSAETFSYHAESLNMSPGFSYSGLDLYNGSANLSFNDNNPAKDPTLKELETIFPNAKNLHITKFKRVPDSSIYHGTVQNAWVFNQLNVEVTTTGNQPSNPLDVRISVPSISSKISESTNYIGSVELANLSGEILETTVKRVADTASVVFEGKRLHLILKDSYSQAAFDEPNAGDAGFEVEANWQGHGVRSFFY